MSVESLLSEVKMVPYLAQQQRLKAGEEAYFGGKFLYNETAPGPSQHAHHRYGPHRGGIAQAIAETRKKVSEVLQNAGCHGTCPARHGGQHDDLCGLQTQVTALRKGHEALVFDVADLDKDNDKIRSTLAFLKSLVEQSLAGGTQISLLHPIPDNARHLLDDPEVLFQIQKKTGVKTAKIEKDASGWKGMRIADIDMNKIDRAKQLVNKIVHRGWTFSFLDMFGSSDEDEDEEKERIKKKRLKAYAYKKSQEPTVIAKSSIMLDVKPWDDETDLAEMEELVRSIEEDGLVWKGGNMIPVLRDIQKLQIFCVIEDDKVSIDDLIETITEQFADHVQSVDIVTFNKI